MRYKLLLFIALLMLSATSCKKRTCTCVDIGGTVQTGIKLTASEECSDLEPMMGECTEE